MFRAAKDAIAAKAAQTYINEKLARYAEVQRLHILSGEGKMEVVCKLHGESEPISVEIGRYAIEGHGNEKMLRLADCRCERPWVQNLLTDFVEHRSFPLPSWAAAALT